MAGSASLRAGCFRQHAADAIGQEGDILRLKDCVTVGVDTVHVPVSYTHLERDEKVLEQLGLSPELKKHLELHITDCEHELDDDAESIITNQRYSYISSVAVSYTHLLTMRMMSSFV